MRWAGQLPKLTTVLGASVLAVYAVIIVGATASLAAAVRACQTWPGCRGSLLDPGVMIALGHRGLALAAGFVILTATVLAWKRDVERRVRSVCTLAVAIYPLQIGVGALLVATPGSAVSDLHLLVGLSIFVLLVVALAWQLEAETGTDDRPHPDTGIESADFGGTTDAENRSTTAVTNRPLRDRLAIRLSAYVSLMKPRLMWLLCLVAAAAMVVAGSGSVEGRTVLLTLGGGVLAIGASGTFNHVLERDRDERMARTNERPLVTQIVPRRNAVLFGVLLTVLSIVAFLQVNPLTAALGLLAIVFYSVIYTLVLKPNTVQNTVLGGTAGSLPALIGWAAVTGRIGIAGVLLAGLIFVWTPAHFYNLALAYKEDYARGGFPMMPVVRGETTTRKHILLWLGATLAAAVGMVWVADLGWLVALTTLVAGGVFLYAVIRLHRVQTEEAAIHSFHASNAYLGLLLIAIVVDVLAL